MKGFIILLIAVVLITLVLIGPVFSIWTLNLLFGLSIPVNVSTWFAGLWMNGILGGMFAHNKGSK